MGKEQVLQCWQAGPPAAELHSANIHSVYAALCLHSRGAYGGHSSPVACCTFFLSQTLHNFEDGCD